MTKLTFLLCAFLCSTSLVSAQTSLLHVDFKNDTPNQGPNGATLSGLPQGRIIVTDQSSSPTDPFGPSENKSLLIEKATTGSPPTAKWDLSTVSAGELTFTIYAQQEGTFTAPAGIAYLYDSNAIGLGVGWNAAGTLYILGRAGDGDSVNTSISLTTRIIFNTPLVIKVTFAEGQFSVFLNDELLQAASGQSNFFFRTGVESFDNIRFSTPSTTDVNDRWYLNEFSVTSIPEASAASLLGLAGVAGFLFRMKNRIPWKNASEA